MNYIFGYGSLIERESRTRTNPNAISARPVLIEGIARGWWIHGAPIGFSTCFLGASVNIDARCNGVLYPVTDAELEQLDQREQGYNRERISPDRITFYDGGANLPENASIYFYALKDSTTPQLPSAIFPIVQSYVDICLNGCLEIEALYPDAKKANFAQMFIETTADWSNYWVNDRLYPRRAFVHVPRCFQIDKLLYDNVQEQFEAIQLEPAHWGD